MDAGDAGKKRLRDEARARRAAVSPEVRARAAEAIAEIGLGFLNLGPGTIVAGYAARGDELDPALLMLRISDDGHRLALPAVVAPALPLVFRAWSLGEPLAAGRWGIGEPHPQAPAVTPDVVLVPLLAFDRRGGRIGYGGGFYDRSLAQLRAGAPVIAVGLAFEEQEVDAVPSLDYDQKLDWVLTPAGPLSCAGN
jgi:5-formyltetrahydrofolate cyclo-ligase